METYFAKVKNFLLDLEYNIVSENKEDEIFVVDNEEAGISNMMIVCAEPILVMEQYLFDIKKEDINVFRNLLQKNRDIIHGAFVLDETGKKVLFRDTLQLENLDLNELEGSLNSLSLLLSEYTKEILAYSTIA
ncbi:MAG: molecular chaperone Tir [Bacteroidia bacterium]|nr:MAG: molecular chaperone Tir [Bacteroidia bacterium]